jgi:hypothetical protein
MDQKQRLSYEEMAPASLLYGECWSRTEAAETNFLQAVTGYKEKTIPKTK